MSRTAKTVLLVLAVAFVLLRFVHLTADYPRNIRWDDGIATDEGWYASSAVNQQTWGTGYLPGDMNIPVLMPVWSSIANAAFQVGGFHVVTLRTTAALFFVLCLLLVCLLLHGYGARNWIPLFAALLAANPWSFAFSRSAFLEFPMLAFCLFAAVLLQRLSRRNAWRLIALLCAGALFAGGMLLKTTAIVLAPVLAYVLLQTHGFHVRRSVREGLVFVFGAVAVYGPYWQMVIVPHHADAAFYLSVVKNTLRLTPMGFLADASRPFRYGLGSDHLLFALSLVAIPVSLLSQRARVLWRDPLFALPAVWLITFLGFMVEHNNDPARYFAITTPAVLMLGVALLRNKEWASLRLRQVLLACIILDLGCNAVQISASMLHPRYTFRDASLAIGAIVRSEPGQSQVVIGDNAHEVALQNGLRPVNLLFHAASIAEQMQRYEPGWWVQFSPIEDGRCYREVLSHAYVAEQRGEWTIFYPGQQLVLYKLTKIPGASLPSTLTAEQTAACSPPVY